MKPFVYRIMFVLSLVTWGFFSGQATTLGIGDIAITGYNSDTNNDDNADRDEFVFVLLTDITGTTIISFTDNGWQSSGSFRTGEGIVTLTITKTYSCGTEIRLDKLTNAWSAFDDSGASAGTISQAGDLDLSSSGDQLFAFNGSSLPNSETDPDFLAAIDFEGSAGWDANAANSNTSDLPTIFANNSGTSFSVAHMDNGKFDCTGTNSTTSGLPVDLRTNIYTANNWQFEDSGSARFDFTNFCNFTCTAACTDPTINSLTTNSSIGSNTFCSGDNVVITINGSPGDATTWNLYTGSCGGTLVGSTTATDGATFTINSIAATTTYYVGGTGGCVASPTCTSILITVNGLTANAGSDQKVSGSATANLSGNGTGSWSIIGAGDGNGYFDAVPGTFTSNNPTATFTGTAGQQYELQWTVTNVGCPSSSADVVI
nr:hypothetical protein [Saprospiraceae bacterium]